MGGLRIGEMEQWAIWCHGASNFLRESVMDRSDKFEIIIDQNTGLMSYGKEVNDKCAIELPYSMKLLLHELYSMSICVRLVTNVTNINENVSKFLLQSMDANETEIKIPDEIEFIDMTNKTKLDEIMDTEKFIKRKDVYEIDESEKCLGDVSWIQLDKIKNPKDYTEYVKKISTNNLYETFNQLYFHAGDTVQFERYGYMKSRCCRIQRQKQMSEICCGTIT